MPLNEKQVKQLLTWVNENRVIEANKHKHLAQQDVRAHLIRIFGFGNFDIAVKTLECVFEEPFIDKKEGLIVGRFNVNYKAIVQLTIRDQFGNQVCQYEDVSSATAQNQNKGDAHSLAMKSAVSGAIKRCAINLGDQFGLSLYNKGQTSAIVKGTLVVPWVVEKTTDEKDIQEGLEKQTSLGIEEDNETINGEVIGEGKTEKRKLTVVAAVEYSEKDLANAAAAFDEIEGFTDFPSLESWYFKIPALHDVPVGKTTIKAAVAAKVQDLQKRDK